MQYLAYSQAPTSVTEAHKGDFYEAGVDSVVQIKHNVIELHLLVPSGLRLALSGTVNGSILKTAPVRLQSHPTSCLAVLTTTFQLFVVAFDRQTAQIKTLASHSVNERGATRSFDFHTLIAGSPKQNPLDPTPFLLIHAFQGLLRIVNLQSNKQTSAGDNDYQGKTEEAEEAEEAEPLDLSRGFTTRIPELLLNGICSLPTPTGEAFRVATIHTNRHGQRVFHTHNINFKQRCLDTFEPGSFDKSTQSFGPAAGITLFDAESSLMIPVKSSLGQGVIVVGSECAIFFQTQAPESRDARNARRRSSASQSALPQQTSSSMMLDDVPEGTTTHSSHSKGKGKSVECPVTSTSPTGDGPIDVTFPQRGPSGGSSRRRSSASKSQGVLATSPTALNIIDPRSGNKRKLSDAANSSGRGKAPARTRSGTLLPESLTDCRLPISEYNCYCALKEDDSAWLLVDFRGKCIYLHLTRTSGQAIATPKTRSSDLPAFGTSPPLATSPTSPNKMSNQRRASRSSLSSSQKLPLKLDAEVIRAGRVSSPTAILQLGGGYLFIGSHYGDSLLARIGQSSRDEQDSMLVDSTESDSTLPTIDIINTYTNLAPIVDMCFVGSESEHGSTHLVTCSGGLNNGTLRIIRHGVSIAEVASLEMESVQRVFALEAPEDEQYVFFVERMRIKLNVLPCSRSVVAVSFLNETRILSISTEDGVEELQNFGRFDADSSSLLAHSHAGHSFQVTASRVIGDIADWSVPAGRKITLAAAHQDKILLAMSGGYLCLLDIAADGQLKLSGQTHLEHEAACVDLAVAPSETGSPPKRLIAAVGLWQENAVVLVDIPNLTIIDTIDVQTAFLLRSILLVNLGEDVKESSCLFVGLGDGTLVSYTFTSTGRRLDRDSRKVVVLGTRPITLVRFATAGNTESGSTSVPAVLAVSDRSTVISMQSAKLTYSSVNTKGIHMAVALNTGNFPTSILYASGDSLFIGRIEQLQKLDIQTLRVGEETPRRICHSKEMKSYGVGFLKDTLDEAGSVSRSSNFKVLDEDAFEVSFQYDFNLFEEARSTACLNLSIPNESARPAEYFVVGTAFIEPGEEESTRGRILIFTSIGEGQYELLAETETRGAVHSLAQLPNGKFVASCNSDVSVYAFTNGQLGSLANWGATFISYGLTVKDDLICVVDPLRSASLIRWMPDEKRLVDVGKDFATYGLYAAAFLRDESTHTATDNNDVSIIAADIDQNLFTARNIDLTATAAKSTRDTSKVYTLKSQAMIHTAESINKFVPGSLVPGFSKSNGGPSPQVTFGTSVGSIGMVASLPQETSTLLSAVERNLRKWAEKGDGNLNIGGLSHEEYRAFKAEYRSQPSAGFIDGSLLENLLTLTAQEIDEVLKGTSEFEAIPTDKRQTVIQTIEDLQRLH